LLCGGGEPRRSSKRASRRRDEAEDVDREGEADAGEEHWAWVALIFELHYFNSSPFS